MLAGAMKGARMITLYAEQLWDSPFVYTVMVALEEKRVPYQTHVLNLALGEQRSPAFQSSSLTARVPAIEHDGFWLSESLAIVEYLEEVTPEPALFPGGLRERARARQILGWLRSDLQALRRDRSTESMFYERAREPLTAGGRADADKLVRVTSALLSSGGDWLFGDFGIADADLAFMLARLHLNGDALPEPIARYVERVWQRPSVQVYMGQPRPPAPR
jgi:glutathione S-transferase